MRNLFSPTPVTADDAPQRTALETAERPGVEEAAVEWGGDTLFDSHDFQSERLTLLAQRFCAFAGGASSMAMLGLFSVAVGDALAGQIQGWITIFGVPFFGLASIYAWQLSHQYGAALLDDYAFECRQGHEAQQVAGILADELIRARADRAAMFLAYRATLAAETTSEDAGAEFPSEVVYLNGTPRRDH